MLSNNPFVDSTSSKVYLKSVKQPVDYKSVVSLSLRCSACYFTLDQIIPKTHVAEVW